MRYRSGEARGGAERASEEEERRGRGEPPHLNGERSRAGPSLPRAAEAIRRAAGGHPRSLLGLLAFRRGGGVWGRAGTARRAGVRGNASKGGRSRAAAKKAVRVVGDCSLGRAEAAA